MFYWWINAICLAKAPLHVIVIVNQLFSSHSCGSSWTPPTWKYAQLEVNINKAWTADCLIEIKCHKVSVYMAIPGVLNRFLLQLINLQSKSTFTVDVRGRHGIAGILAYRLRYCHCRQSSLFIENTPPVFLPHLILQLYTDQHRAPSLVPSDWRSDMHNRLVPVAP